MHVWRSKWFVFYINQKCLEWRWLRTGDSGTEMDGNQRAADPWVRSGPKLVRTRATNVGSRPDPLASCLGSRASCFPAVSLGGRLHFTPLFFCEPANLSTLLRADMHVYTHIPNECLSSIELKYTIFCLVCFLIDRGGMSPILPPTSTKQIILYHHTWRMSETTYPQTTPKSFVEYLI